MSFVYLLINRRKRMTNEKQSITEEVKAVAVEDSAKADPELKEFLRKPERFADVFNAVCFGGEQVLNAENLYELDTDVSGVVAFKQYRESLIRNRDVLKKTVNDTKFLILGVENQGAVDYTMPLRVMVYDGMTYIKEVKAIGTRGKELKVTPIITIVMYYGSKMWDGPKCLKDMMSDVSDNLESYISDYQMNLLEVLHDDKYDFQDEDVKMLFEYSQAIVRKDRVRIEELSNNYKLKSDVVYAIGKFIDIKEAIAQLKMKNMEEIDMCELFDDIREEGRTEGRTVGIKGMIESLKELNIATEVIVIQIMKQFHLSEVDARELL